MGGIEIKENFFLEETLFPSFYRGRAEMENLCGPSDAGVSFEQCEYA